MRYADTRGFFGFCNRCKEAKSATENKKSYTKLWMQDFKKKIQRLMVEKLAPDQLYSKQRY